MFFRVVSRLFSNGWGNAPLPPCVSAASDVNVSNVSVQSADASVVGAVAFPGAAPNISAVAAAIAEFAGVSPSRVAAYTIPGGTDRGALMLPPPPAAPAPAGGSGGAGGGYGYGFAGPPPPSPPPPSPPRLVPPQAGGRRSLLLGNQATSPASAQHEQHDQQPRARPWRRLFAAAPPPAPPPVPPGAIPAGSAACASNESSPLSVVVYNISLFGPGSPGFRAARTAAGQLGAAFNDSDPRLSQILSARV